MLKYGLALLDKYPSIRYLFAGGFNTVVSLLLYYGLIKLGLNYLLASSVSNVFGVIEGFLLNSYLVFKHKPHWRGLFKYSTVYAISFFINLGLMYFWVDIVHMSQLLAPFPTITIATILNYLLIKSFVFNKARSDVSTRTDSSFN